ncbi:hypothetical protein R5R35_012342 [Gryllus longicercus]|uniref:Uncharacterized protein n=1 Tax=Gryllus longicercus TaxID=2509291 RepID=A0AAN9VE72_9ORTH
MKTDHSVPTSTGRRGANKHLPRRRCLSSSPAGGGARVAEGLSPPPTRDDVSASPPPSQNTSAAFPEARLASARLLFSSSQNALTHVGSSGARARSCNGRSPSRQAARTVRLISLLARFVDICKQDGLCLLGDWRATTSGSLQSRNLIQKFSVITYVFFEIKYYYYCCCYYY